MAFSFNFSGDDIDAAADDGGASHDVNLASNGPSLTDSAPVEVQQHELKEWVGLLLHLSFLLSDLGRTCIFISRKRLV